MSLATIRDPLQGANVLEREYAAYLDLLKRAGKVEWWAYESLRLRLADGTFYTPDFVVVHETGRLEIHETKGHMREAARVRLKVAADRHPFLFRLVRRVKGEWQTEVVQ